MVPNAWLLATGHNVSFANVTVWYKESAAPSSEEDGCHTISHCQ